MGGLLWGEGMGQQWAASLGCHLYIAPGDKWALLSLSSLQQGAVGTPVGFGTWVSMAAVWRPLGKSGRQETCGPTERETGTVSSWCCTPCPAGTAGVCLQHKGPAATSQHWWEGGSLRQSRELGQSASVTQLYPSSEFILGRVNGFPQSAL